MNSEKAAVRHARDDTVDAAASAGLSECGSCFVPFPTQGPRPAAWRGPSSPSAGGVCAASRCRPSLSLPYRAAGQPSSMRPFINNSFLFQGIR